ncbi:hypothetical protein ACGFY9_05770 [Streptomyces sp. NPDC048504]|uniref:hypothetical protein n=1 Tax=Streptomyces sp. NPDC048504 TaxID=3365559 RepID=UPI00370FBE44
MIPKLIGEKAGGNVNGRRRSKRAAGVGAAVTFLFAAVASCGSGATDKAPSITAPEVFYL